MPAVDWIRDDAGSAEQDEAAEDHRCAIAPVDPAGQHHEPDDRNRNDRDDGGKGAEQACPAPSALRRPARPILRDRRTHPALARSLARRASSAHLRQRIFSVLIPASQEFPLTVLNYTLVAPLAKASRAMRRCDRHRRLRRLALAETRPRVRRCVDCPAAIAAGRSPCCRRDETMVARLTPLAALAVVACCSRRWVAETASATASARDRSSSATAPPVPMRSRCSGENARGWLQRSATWANRTGKRRP